MLAIYNQKIGELKIYDVENHKQLLYPHELEKFVVYTCSGWYIDKTPRKFFLFHSKLFYQKDGNLCCITLGKTGSAKIQVTNFNGQM